MDQAIWCRQFHKPCRYCYNANDFHCGFTPADGLSHINCAQGGNSVAEALREMSKEDLHTIWQGVLAWQNNENQTDALTGFMVNLAELGGTYDAGHRDAFTLIEAALSKEITRRYFSA